MKISTSVHTPCDTLWIQLSVRTKNLSKSSDHTTLKNAMSSLFPPQFQIASDLHLETPVLSKGSYHNFTMDLKARYLCLLGDIGLVKEAGLFSFLRGLLDNTPNLIILYVLGNHEAYQTTMANARQLLRDFAARIAEEYPGSRRFIFLDRQRYDVNLSVTVLGCTLWTRIQPEQMPAVCKILTDFHPNNGISEWGPYEHLQEHQKDLEWLNTEVARIEKEEPEREIVILTHHCPTQDTRANNPRHARSNVSSGFVTDLSQERCWTSPHVKLWAFGHTHYSCSYREGETGKLVVANQKGYNGIGAFGSGIGTGKSSFKTVVVEMRSPLWQLLTYTESALHARKKSHTDTGREDGKERRGSKENTSVIPSWLRFGRSMK
jgi:hypothetical protein